MANSEFILSIDAQPEEVAAQLSVAVMKNRWSNWGHAGLMGAVSKERIYIWFNHSNHRNSFAPALVGSFEAAPSGCTLVGKFGMRHSVRFFLILWFSLNFLFSLPSFLDLSAGRARISDFNELIIMLVLGIAVLLVGRLGSKGDTAKIRAELINIYEEARD